MDNLSILIALVAVLLGTNVLTLARLFGAKSQLKHQEEDRYIERFDEIP